MNEIYHPAEDSYLISETLKRELPKLLKKNPDLKFLEVGCGSGINLKSALNSGIKKGNILGTDVNPKAVNYCENLGFKVILSDLFSKVKGKFDIIAFNPPYLPLDKNEPKSSQPSTTAGKKGNELIIKFLKNAKKYLDENGKIFLITSSLSETVDFVKLGYKPKKINSRKLFFEELFLWEIGF